MDFGIQVTNIPMTVTWKELFRSFSNLQESTSPKKIFYPIAKNTAVLLYENEKAQNLALRKQYHLHSARLKLKAFSEKADNDKNIIKLDSNMLDILQKDESGFQQLKKRTGVNLIKNKDSSYSLQGSKYALKCAKVFMGICSSELNSTSRNENADVQAVAAMPKDSVYPSSRYSASALGISEDIHIGSSFKEIMTQCNGFSSECLGLGQYSPSVLRHFSFEMNNNVTVSVVLDNIVNVNTMVIVCPANKKLMNIGGVAAAISNAAGNHFDEMCKQMLAKHSGNFDTGDIITTSPGGILSGKYVIHVASPENRNYIDLNGRMDSKLCDFDLIRSYINCLTYANDTLKCASIAFPAISSGVHGIDLDASINAFYDALLLFTMDHRTEKVLQNIQFVIFDEESATMARAILDQLTSIDIVKSLEAAQERYGYADQKLMKLGAKKTKAVNCNAAVGALSLTDLNINDSIPGQFADFGACSKSAFRSANPEVSSALDVNGKLLTEAADERKQLSPSGENIKDDSYCTICMDSIKDKKTLAKCKHSFCRMCIDKYAKINKPVCPVCGEIFGEIHGNQPKDGTMTYSVIANMNIPGYESSPGAIKITYNIPDGIQGPNHPNPGKIYRGICRVAYLPNSKEGHEVLKLLQKAFNAGLIFTIGCSNTTGCDNVITWNDIHHKTNLHGGTFGYGYPDDTYLDRVRKELKSNGIE